MIKELSYAAQWLETGVPVALAVVAETWGSAPRRTGSIMVIRDDGTFEGSVSGGCVEGAVIADAQALNSQEEPFKELVFAVSSEQAWDVGLACGGEITIWLFSLAEASVEPLKAAASDLSSGKSGCLTIEATHVGWREHQSAPVGRRPVRDGAAFNIPLLAPIKLAVVGAVHIAQHLAALARECEFDTTVIDPRHAFTDNRAFAGAKLLNEWPDDHFAANPPSERTAVVTLTHDPKLDDAALHQVLGSRAFYIGSLGSKRTHSARLDRLQSQGHSERQLTKIHAPIGLDIEAATPAEIAVAIMAQIIDKARRDP